MRSRMVLLLPAHNAAGSARPLTRKIQAVLPCAMVLNFVLTSQLGMKISRSKTGLGQGVEHDPGGPLHLDLLSLLHRVELFNE